MAEASGGARRRPGQITGPHYPQQAQDTSPPGRVPRVSEPLPFLDRAMMPLDGPTIRYTYIEEDHIDKVQFHLETDLFARIRPPWQAGEYLIYTPLLPEWLPSPYGQNLVAWVTATPGVLTLEAFLPHQGHATYTDRRHGEQVLLFFARELARCGINWAQWERRQYHGLSI